MTEDERTEMYAAAEREDAADQEQIKTPEGYYNFLKARKHPSILKVEEHGGAELVTGTHDCLWIGDVSAVIEMVPRAMRDVKSSSDDAWPHARICFDSYGSEIHLELVGTNGPNTFYKRTDV